jgi:5-oxoprolinase (ATP-hydrolysing) subunit C
MGSASTDLRAGFGGHAGRALRGGDRLSLGASRIAAVSSARVAPWWIDARPDIDIDQAARLHVLGGPDATAPSTSLFGAGWCVSARSDRQGLRLDGPPLRAHDAGERISSAVAPGAIQLPPDGQPIVLLADAQTTGGYPCVGYVASADLPRLGQCRPGDELHFAPLDTAAALLRLRAQDARLQRIAIAVAQRLAG